MMKRNAFTLVEAIIVVAFMAILATGVLSLSPFFARQRENDSYKPPRTVCLSNLRQMSLGMMQYTKDYDEKLPPAKNKSGGWADLIFPYVKSTQLFQCPAEQGSADKTSDYFFNSRLSGVSMGKLPAPNLTISLGDGLPDQPFDANLSQLPAAWIGDFTSPANRHLDGANYAFADGHVKWFKPGNITLDKPDKNNPTFLLGSIQP